MQQDEDDTPTGETAPLEQLLGPASHIEEGIPDKHPAFTKASAGYVGAIVRLAKGVKPYVWVANGHNEGITVVVSKFKPNRVTAGFGVNAAADGGGIDCQKELWYQPATKKELQPNEEAVFPLWSRKNGYGVVTIYKGVGDGKKLFIENDRISAGAQVTFAGGANLFLSDIDGNMIPDT